MNKIIRKKNGNYTVVSNVCIRDNRLSLKAKGLMSLVMSLPNDWDFSIQGLSSIVKEGKSAIYTAINELKDFGYCQVVSNRDDKGKIIGNDYTFFEEPCTDIPYTENQDTDNQNMDNQDLENQPQINKDIREIKTKIIKEEDTNVSPKKNDYQVIVDCWNEYNGAKLGKVMKLTERRKKSIRRVMGDNDITQEQLMTFFKALPYADSWLYNPNKQHRNWKPDFDWWMANTNGWLTKALEGKVHNENPKAFERIMKDGTFSSQSVMYLPQGRTIWFNEDTQSYWSDYNFYDECIYDGYTDDERPDGAEITLNNARGTYKWNSNSKKWEKK